MPKLAAAPSNHVQCRRSGFLSGKSKGAEVRAGRLLPVVSRIIKGWRYTGDKRDLRLDLLRGFAALTMVIDHIGGKESLLYTISGGDRFFTSAAEGFVFISGLVMGIVYASLIARKGIRAALTKGAKRVATLYSLAVGLSFVFGAVSSLLDMPWATELTSDNLFTFIGDILTLHRTFYLTDVMVLYTLVIALALPLLVLMARGLSWVALLASWGLWAAWQWWPNMVQLPFGIGR